MKKIYLIILVGLISFQLFSQDINVMIDQILCPNFPKMQVYVSVTENGNTPVMSLVPGNFTALVDGKKIDSKITVEGFQYSDIGIAYAILVSANGLMEGEALAEQQKAVINLMEALREQDTLSVYYFGDEVKTLFEFQKKNEGLSKQLTKIEVLGSNPKLYDALVFSARRLNEAKEKRKVLLVMSDGRDVESKYSREQFLKIIDEMNVPMYGCGIYLMGGRNLSNINTISIHTGGGYNVAYTPVMISKKLKELNDQIAHGYIVKINANIMGDNQFHQLQINVNKDGRTATFSKNFTATKIPFPLWVKLVFAIVLVILLAALIVGLIFLQRRNRKKLGINRRRCPECKRRMKDDWDDCPFCKYLPPKKKKEKLEKQDN